LETKAGGARGNPPSLAPVSWSASVYPNRPAGQDLLDIMGTFRRKGTIMSTTQAQTMLDEGFGIDVRMSTPLGMLYNKNGAWPLFRKWSRVSGNF
jgi:hypothetical protein